MSASSGLLTCGVPRRYEGATSTGDSRTGVGRSAPRPWRRRSAPPGGRPGTNLSVTRRLSPTDWLAGSSLCPTSGWWQGGNDEQKDRSPGGDPGVVRPRRGGRLGRRRRRASRPGHRARPDLRWLQVARGTRQCPREVRRRSDGDVQGRPPGPRRHQPPGDRIAHPEGSTLGGGVRPVPGRQGTGLRSGALPRRPPGANRPPIPHHLRRRVGRAPARPGQAAHGDAERQGRLPRRAPASRHRPQHRLHRRSRLVEPARRTRQGGPGHDRRHRRQRHLAREPLGPGRRRPAGASREVGGHGLRVRLGQARRSPLCLRQQADRRPPHDDDLRHLRPGSRGGRVLHGPRQQRAREPHRHDGGRKRQCRRRVQRHAPGRPQRRRPAGPPRGLQGVLHGHVGGECRLRVLLHLRLGRRHRAGHPRRRGRHQLLDRRRHEPVLGRRVAGLPRRLRRRRLRGLLGRQRGPRRQHRRPSRALDNDGRRQHDRQALLRVGPAHLRFERLSRGRRRVRLRRHPARSAGGPLLRRALRQRSLPGPGGARLPGGEDRGLQAGHERPGGQERQRGRRGGRGHDSLQHGRGAESQRGHPLRAERARRRRAGDGPGVLPRLADGRFGLHHRRSASQRPGRRDRVLQLARGRGPGSRHQQARRGRPGGGHPRGVLGQARGAHRAGRPDLQHPQRHVDGFPARGRRRRAPQAAAPELGAGRHQVRAHDDGDRRRREGGRRHAGDALRRRQRANRPGPRRRCRPPDLGDGRELRGVAGQPVDGELP